jgi:tRNA nucleotidyltransferase (CCA-adding enzyme)
MKIPDILNQIAARIDKEGGTPILVGGFVRDFLLGLESKDFDVEVFNLHYHQLTALLKKFGKVSAVGKAFGVLKLSISGYHFDFSLPRNDLKTGYGHKGFSVTTDPAMSFRSAAARRDFTINSMGYDILSRKILDEFGGRSDLDNKVLRVVDPKTFGDDPLRVLRGIQFAARFRLSVPRETKDIMISLIDTLDELPRERVFKEVQKLLLEASQPSDGIRIADEIGVIKKLFPELNALHAIPYDPEWYTDRDAWSHTLHVIDEAANLKGGDSFQDTALMLAALCHEFTSLNPTEFTDEKWTRRFKTQACPTVTKCFLNRITNEIKLIETVDSLVSEHQSMNRLFRSSQIKNGDIRRLSLRVNIPLLIRVAEADFYGRFNSKDRPTQFPAGEWLLKRYYALKLNNGRNLQPLLLGRHLISLGLKPGPFFGKILTDAYQKQLDDKFMTLDDAINWAREQIETIPDTKPKHAKI